MQQRYEHREQRGQAQQPCEQKSFAPTIIPSAARSARQAPNTLLIHV